MKNFLFQKAILSRNISTSDAYYRLYLSDLFPNIDKMICLNDDTLTFNDLKKMYDINMEGFYYKEYFEVSQDNYSLIVVIIYVQEYC